MKKLNLCIAGAAALLCTSCSDSDGVKDLTGTSEELNEIADKGSSSSGTPDAEFCLGCSGRYGIDPYA